MDETLFERLKNLREVQKLSLEEISTKSRIRLHYLQAIEAGTIEQIPDVYDKLFFQTYLSFLKIDESEREELYKEFKSLRKVTKPHLTTTVRQIKLIKPDLKDLSRSRKLFFVLPLIIVVFIIIFMAINSTKVELGSGEEVPELEIRDIVKEVETLKDTLSDSVSDAGNIAFGQITPALKILIKANQKTWLRVISDRADTSEYLLNIDDRLNLEPDSLAEFLIGKANGLELFLNGSSLGSLGSEGEVITYMKIKRDGIQSKRIKRIVRETILNDTLSTD